MPPRLFSLAIIVFWTTMTGWLLYREVWPQFRAGKPPPYTIDLTEEVGANMVSWTILQKGERVGLGHSQVTRLADRTFELHSQFRFDQMLLKLPVFGGQEKSNLLKLKKIAGVYHVTETGRLLGLSSTFIVGKDALPGAAMLDFELEIRGDVHEDVLVLDKMLVSGQQQEVPAWAQAHIPVRGNVFNPMQLLNRVPGLRPESRWRVPLLEPLGGQLSVLSTFLPHSLSMPELEASVETVNLAWNDEEVACYQILYRKPGDEEVRARPWARRRDGLVLQQEASVAGHGFVIQRVPPK
jgi:hypothetical protein